MSAICVKTGYRLWRLDHVSIGELPMTSCMCAFSCPGVMLLSQTGVALSFFVDTDLASEAFIVCFVGSRDRIVPFGPGRVCVCISVEKPSLRHFKVPTGHVRPPVFGARRRPCGARKPSSRHFKDLTGHVSPPVFGDFQRSYGAGKPSCV